MSAAVAWSRQHRRRPHAVRASRPLLRSVWYALEDPWAVYPGKLAPWAPARWFGRRRMGWFRQTVRREQEGMR
jgi:hypothetical protein